MSPIMYSSFATRFSQCVPFVPSLPCPSRGIPGIFDAEHSGSQKYYLAFSATFGVIINEVSTPLIVSVLSTLFSPCNTPLAFVHFPTYLDSYVVTPSVTTVGSIINASV